MLVSLDSASKYNYVNFTLPIVTLSNLLSNQRNVNQKSSDNTSFTYQMFRVKMLLKLQGYQTFMQLKDIFLDGKLAEVFKALKM